MILKILDEQLSVCKLSSVADIDLAADFYFLGKTDEEISLVCKTGDVPAAVTAREDGWKAFRIQGVLDFSLTGILSRLSGILAANGIGIFAVSTYQTDYILVKEENLPGARLALEEAGYRFVP